MKKLRLNRFLTLAMFAGLTPMLAQGETAAGIVASASAVNGSVQVNKGAQFQPLLTGQALGAGDRIMALSNGSATITFADGCTLAVASETLVVVPAISTCAGGEASVQAVTPGSAQAVGTPAAEPASVAGQRTASGMADAGFAVAAAAVLAGGAIVSATEDEKDVSSP